MKETAKMKEHVKGGKQPIFEREEAGEWKKGIVA
jgi:hypothetical protein